jgi:hypothetical protein
MRYQSLSLFVVFLLTVSVGFGQGSPVVITSTGNGNGHASGIAGFMPPPFLSSAVTGAPYSGEETQEHVQTLSDGTHITQNMMRRTMYRDSLGRTRVERPLGMAPHGEGPPSPTMIEITDPTAAVQYTLDTHNKVAHRVTFSAQPSGGRAVGLVAITRSGPSFAATLSAGPVAPPSPSPAPANAIVRPAGRPQFNNETLGTQVIEGVLAEGERRTITVPEGEQGNDRAFQITSETWTSPELKLVVLSKNSDPRSGDNIVKMTNISRSEPDPSLFQVPPDYTIVDETGQFTIQYTN